MIVDDLVTTDVAEGKTIIVTGPDPQLTDIHSGLKLTPVKHEETDILIAYHAINEAVAGCTPIIIMSDDTDVLVIMADRLHAKTNNMPSTVQILKPRLHDTTCCHTSFLFFWNWPSQALRKAEALTDR